MPEMVTYWEMLTFYALQVLSKPCNIYIWVNSSCVVHTWQRSKYTHDFCRGLLGCLIIAWFSPMIDEVFCYDGDVSMEMCVCIILGFFSPMAGEVCYYDGDVPLEDRCFYFPRMSYPWDEGVWECETYGGWLAQIQDESDFETVKSVCKK